MMISRNAAGRRQGFTNAHAGAAHRMLWLAVLLVLTTLITSCHRPDNGETGAGSIPGKPGLTDLTDYARQAEGTLCAYALHDDSHIMLLTLCGALFHKYVARFCHCGHHSGQCAEPHRPDVVHQ